MIKKEHESKSLLQVANKYFRKKKYKESLYHYQKLQETCDKSLSKTINFNINICMKKLGLDIDKNENLTKGPVKNYNALSKSETSDRKSIILFHIFHIEIAHQILHRLEEAMDSSIDVLVTCNKEIVDKVKEILPKKGRSFEILNIESNGYDLLPFVKGFLYAKKKGYKFFCKLHTKRDHPNELIGKNWRDSLLDGVIPDSKNISKILDTLENDKSISIVCSAINYLSYEGNKYNNDNYLKLLLEKIGHKKPSGDFGFVAGSMFWGRFEDFSYIDGSFIEYLEKHTQEKLKSGTDSSIWHAFERGITIPAIHKKNKIGLIDYDISSESPFLTIYKAPSNEFLKSSASIRYQAYQNKEKQRKYSLLQKSGVVEPDWCFYHFDKEPPYDCYQSFINGEIKYLSSRHMSGEIDLEWKDRCLYIKENKKIEKVRLDSKLLTKSIVSNDIFKKERNFIDQTDDVMVSVICITYLHEKYIKQALESMIRQKTNFKFEILISDDCSPDKSSDIIQDYANKYPDLIVYIKRDKNIGARKNSTDLLKRARGKYLAFNEGDDYWIDDKKLQVQVDYLEKTPDCAICFHQVKVIDENDSKIINFFPGKQSKSIFTTEDFVQRNYIQTNSLVFRKNTLGISVLPDERIMPGDWYRHILNTLLGDAHLLPRVMSVYRKHSGGIWSSQRQDLHKIWGLNEVVFFNSIDKQLKYIYHSDFFTKKISIFKVCFFHFYNTDQRYKIFELCMINTDLTNYFFKHHKIKIQINESLNYNDFLSSLRNALSVDVIVTSYNHEQHIEQALNSIIDQEGLFSINVYVSDDCSTDGTIEKIRKVKSEHHYKIHDISPSENLGLQKNMRHAFSHIKSDYFAICEGDDYWLDKSKLRKQVAYLIENTDASMCFNWIMLEYVNKGYSVPHPGQEKIKSDAIDFDFILNTAVTANFSCCMYRSSILNAIPTSYYENPRAADWLFNLYAANEGKVGFLRDILSVYRVHDGGQWSRLSPCEQAFRRNESYKLFSQLFPERRDSIIKNINNALLVNNEKLNIEKKFHIKNNRIRSNLDRYSQEFGYTSLSGWAFLKNSTEKKVPWIILLDGNNKIIEFYSCSLISRPDVKGAIKECDVELCGFKSIFKLSKTDLDGHTLAVCFECDDGIYANTLMQTNKLLALEEL